MALFTTLSAVIGVLLPVPDASPRTYVVIVAISDYADRDIHRKPHAEDDAKSLYDLFTSKDHRVHETVHTRLLLGKEDAARKSEPATRRNILDAARWLRWDAREQDQAIFVFIGQGGTTDLWGERRCYFASNSTVAGRARDAVSAAELAEIFDAVKCRRLCAYLDVNFNGYTPKKSTPAAEADGIGCEFLGNHRLDSDERKLEIETPIKGRVLFLANDCVSPSLDGKKNGAFAEAMLRALKGSADHDGGEADGWVTVHELAAALKKELADVAIDGLGIRDFDLTPNPAARTTATKRIELLNKLESGGAISKERATEGRQLLERMPRVTALRTLREKYVELTHGKMAINELEKARARILEEGAVNPAKAQKFAEVALRGAEMIREEYVRPVSVFDLVGDQIRGLYEEAGETVPARSMEALRLARSREDLIRLLVDARITLGVRENLPDGVDTETSLDTALRALDPYSRYLGKDKVEFFRTRVVGYFTGVGLQMRRDLYTGHGLVVTPVFGGPAHKAGIRAGDLIDSVKRAADPGGVPIPLEEIKFRGLSLKQMQGAIVGRDGVPLRLVIRREGKDQPLEMALTRAAVQTQTVWGVCRKVDDSWDFMMDRHKRIGYIRIREIDRDTSDHFVAALGALRREGVKGLIIDLRFNPGGLLRAAQEIGESLIPKGEFCSIRRREGIPGSLSCSGENALLDVPIVVLINGGTMSGAELIAAALQDRRGALVVGERSRGKGSVQNVIPFTGGEMVLTTAEFLRPSGKPLNRFRGSDASDDWGVRPDKGCEVPLTLAKRLELHDRLRAVEMMPPSDLPAFVDVQLEKAKETILTRLKR